MDPHRRRTLERLAAASGLASAIGGAAYALSRKSTRDTLLVPAQPELLNTDRLEPHKRLLINRTALAILCISYPDRKKIMEDLSISKHVTDFGTGYLKHYRLIDREIPERSTGIPPHYVPSVELVETLQDPERFPFMELALQERLAEKDSHTI